MNFKKLMLVALISSLLLSSCSDSDSPIQTPLGAYDDGILILNQGNFGQNNSSISFLSNDFESFEANAFNAVNPGFSLGDTAQDIGFLDEKAFVVLNVSNKIEIINRYTLEPIATINQGLNNPRYIAFSDNKAFVTNWGDGMNPDDDYVAVYFLSDFSFSNNIAVSEGPERILAYDSKLFVTHKGGFNFNNKVSVINANSNQVEQTILVGDVPESIAIANEKIYVLSAGKPAWAETETQGKLEIFNLNTFASEADFTFELGTHPNHLKIENNEIFYTIDAQIFKTSLNFTALPTTPLIEMNPQGVYGIYGFEVHENQIFIADAGDFNSNGKIFIYNTAGDFLHERTVGITPTGFYFN